MNYKDKTDAELLREEERLEEKLNTISDECIKEGLNYEEFCKRAYDVKEGLYFISKELRLRKTPTVEFGKHWQGDTFTMEEFIDAVKSGLFVDSDGYGYYATDNGKSDITIYPSDIIENMYRKDFTHVIWFNK
jgi:hypothetical protein